MNTRRGIGRRYETENPISLRNLKNVSTIDFRAKNE